MAEQATAHEMPAHGTICWNELTTKNVEAAKKFYTELFGWKARRGADFQRVAGRSLKRCGCGER